ncbi:alpha/beta hydrolase [Cupriavidus basilensis]|uniref:Alpha/beta hydrolase n=1 Tax=Cupriavidus basilensis TaxID=68895 RepID=A0ABT6ATC4_9BURK|nr:alpha/beta hydrolase [Cupriavidus basilensis]MDF3835512.1 alpha/beta hydrolase [Cupriavidus basilensis]
MSLQNLLLSYGLRKRLKRGAPPGQIDVAGTRRAMARFGHDARVPAGWRIERSGEAALPGEWTRREAAQARAGANADVPTLFYLHGGGYYFCTPQTHRPLTLALARMAGMQVFSLDYRLAPEHPFPAALDDAVDAYAALLARGISPGHLVIAGDSAGGGLALATLLALRARGMPLPSGALLFSPWTDLAATGATLRSNDRHDVMFHGESIGRAARLYLGNAAATDPLASPLYADPAALAALPPLYVQASDKEVLLDDSRRLVERARAAGGNAELHIWRGVPHVWQLYHPFLPEARRALADAAAFARRISNA